jgi:metallo-beta-lactamase family protein
MATAKLTFYGACEEVTGSNFLLEIGQYKILVECGLFQGGKFAEDKNYEPFPYAPTGIDAVVLTHAHLDHSGRIPKLVKEGFTGKIYATPATRDFCEILWEDSHHLIEEEADEHGHPVLYDEEDIDLALKKFEDIEYQTEIEILPGVKLILRDAGHILGSATADISWTNEKGIKENIVFTGDLGNPPVPLLRPTEYIDKANYVVCESTYGGRIHEDWHTRRVYLHQAIEEIIRSKGVLMMPAFAMERAQELLYELNDFIESKRLPKIPIYLDAPLADAATQIYKKYVRYYNVEAQYLVSRGEFVFEFPGLSITKSVEDSKAINSVPAPKVIIAGSGMMNGGRILHHATRYLPDPNSLLLIVGYQAKGTLGRKIYDGEKVVKIFGENIPVNCHIKAIGAFSAHPDLRKTIAWLANIENPKQVFLVHGESDQMSTLAEAIKNKLGAKAVVAKLNQCISLV